MFSRPPDSRQATPKPGLHKARQAAIRRPWNWTVSDARTNGAPARRPTDRTSTSLKEMLPRAAESPRLTLYGDSVEPGVIFELLTSGRHKISPTRLRILAVTLASHHQNPFASGLEWQQMHLGRLAQLDGLLSKIGHISTLGSPHAHVCDFRGDLDHVLL